jgi:hypothetical protein
VYDAGSPVAESPRRTSEDGRRPAPVTAETAGRVHETGRQNESLAAALGDSQICRPLVRVTQALTFRQQVQRAPEESHSKAIPVERELCRRPTWLLLALDRDTRRWIMKVAGREALELVGDRVQTLQSSQRH